MYTAYKSQRGVVRFGTAILSVSKLDRRKCFLFLMSSFGAYQLLLSPMKCLSSEPGILAGPAHWTADKQHVYQQRQLDIRSKLREMLGMPEVRVGLAKTLRGQIKRDEILIEKWVFTSEPGSRVPCLLFRPQDPPERMPAIVLTYGHGGSKSFWSYQYAAQLYARLGLACLAMDPIGEEERHHLGQRGTREHDRQENDSRAHTAGRPVLGKMVFDATRGIDFLLSRDDIDPERIGLAGNSLGGTVAQFTAAVEPRLRLVLVSGWMYDPYNTTMGKLCTKIPSQRAASICTWDEMLALSAPHCSLLVLNGTADVIIERRPPIGNDDGGRAWSGNHAVIPAVKKVYAGLGGDPSWVDHWYTEAGGHREYFITKTALEWIHRHLGTPRMTLEDIQSLPTINSGRWCDANKIWLERLYGTQLHQRGLRMPDLGIRAIQDHQLAVLPEEESGQPEYTLRGWLDVIDKHKLSED